MSNNLTEFLDVFADLHVLVLGDAMLDSYLDGAAHRLCQEAPVPVVTLSGRRDVPGGAANTAVNVSSLGGRVTFLSIVGGDPEGDRLRQALQERGVSPEHLLTDPARATLAKHRLSAAGQLLVRFDQGSTGLLAAASEDELITALTELFPCCHAVIVSDYGYGVLTARVIAALADLQTHSPRVVVVDSKRLPAYRNVAPTVVKPNYQEALALLGAGATALPENRAEAMTAHGERILELTGARIAAVTLDRDGAFFFERGRHPYRTYARPTSNSRATGAGDTFVSALALALAAGAHTPAAAELASAAATLVVAKEGTAACYAQELREYVAAGTKYEPDLARLAARVDFLRQQGKRIVFTNGCFDILHRGHITYLSQAKALGDILVVGVNSDASIRRLKGPDRPINSLEDRIQVLAALSCTDFLTGFDEDTPCNLIRALRPDVFVKGGDYTRDRLPEVPLVEAQGGVVRILPYMQDRSTTGIIERIQKVSGERAAGRARRVPRR